MPQDPAQVGSKHYKVEFENEEVRVLRILYGPGQKSRMHAHPASVLLPLPDVRARFALPDGKREEFNTEAARPCLRALLNFCRRTLATNRLSPSRSNSSAKWRGWRIVPAV